MTSNNIDLIKDVIAFIEKNNTDFAKKLGVFKEKISDGVFKYGAYNARITHFLVFEKDKKVCEVSFYCENLIFSLQELEAIFGVSRKGYNFRENYTQFSFPQNLSFINELFFIKDNRFEFENDGRITEIDPRGGKTSHKDIGFNAFCFNF